MKLEPLGKRVLIERDKPEERTLGGLYLPDEAQDKPLLGTVVAVGMEVPMGTLQPGDRVVMGKYCGSDVGLEGKVYVVCDVEELLGRLREGD